MFLRSAGDDDAIFSICETVPEIIVVAARLLGDEALDLLVREIARDTPRERLRAYADELALVELKNLADLIRRHARNAKPGPEPFGPGFQTQSAKIVIERRRAERSRLILS